MLWIYNNYRDNTNIIFWMYWNQWRLMTLSGKWVKGDTSFFPFALNWVKWPVWYFYVPWCSLVAPSPCWRGAPTLATTLSWTPPLFRCWGRKSIRSSAASPVSRRREKTGGECRCSGGKWKLDWYFGLQSSHFCAESCCKKAFNQMSFYFVGR